MKKERRIKSVEIDGELIDYNVDDNSVKLKTPDQIRFEKFNKEWEKKHAYYSIDLDVANKNKKTLDGVKRLIELGIEEEMFLSIYVKNDEPIEAVDFQKVIKFIKNNPTATIDIDVFIGYVNQLIEKYKAYNPITTLIEIVKITGVVKAPHDDMYIHLSDGGYLAEDIPIFGASDTRVGMISHEALQQNSEVIEQSKEEIELDVLKRYMKFHNKNNSYENIHIEDIETFLKTKIDERSKQEIELIDRIEHVLKYGGTQQALRLIEQYRFDKQENSENQ